MKKRSILIMGLLGVLSTLFSISVLSSCSSTEPAHSEGSGSFQNSSAKLLRAGATGDAEPMLLGSTSSNTLDDGNTAVPPSVDRDRGPLNPPENLIYPTRNYLYLSSDTGNTWRELDPLKDINTSTYLTAAAVNPKDSQHLLIGTSFQGIYESKNGGTSWERFNDRGGLNLLYQGAGFYDEAAALVFHPSDPDFLLIRQGYSDTWYEYQLSTAKITWTGSSALLEQRLPQIPLIYRRSLELSDDASKPWSGRILPLYPSGWPVPEQAKEQIEQERELDEAFWQRRAVAANKRGIYLNPWQAANNLDDHLSFALDHGMNSIVVDFKDDLGNLTYDSQLDIVDEVDSEWVRFDVKELLRKAHEKGIYVIARVVVFKDKQLYRYKNNSYALWDHTKNGPWGVWRQETPEASEDIPNPEPRWVQIEYWVDPYADFVHQYNIAIARELEELGVDEIQFDYIRFPSDGVTRNIRSRFFTQRGNQPRPTGYEEVGPGHLVVHPELLTQPGWPKPGNVAEDEIRYRVKALGSFLSKARSALTIPIGTDVFGFNAWARMGYLGQDIENISFYVDVISPMAYPSHYARDFLPEQTYFQRAETLYDEGTVRARSIVGDRALIRPYVQAFLIGGELRYERPEYTEYLNLQIRGTINGGGSGFSLWNNSGRYYMVDKESYLKAAEQQHGSGKPDQESGSDSQQAADRPDTGVGG